ncbi:hypothetical protein NDU88_004129 [Pleurodeles waltl]|uniref:Uncharacterized protein n=1 Tax=Pleurodeles waltl TaxID=8319 RepID=A0AAV7MWC3_PLEWA|nr:hypothetical protein NDU88_004129 [Pleurodeles waltl]
MAESRWISPSSNHTSLCLAVSQPLPRPPKGPRVLQRGTGGPRSARASCPFSPRGIFRPQSRWGGVSEVKRLRGQAATYRLWGAPPLHAIAAPVAPIFWSEQRSGASQRDRAVGVGASSVPRIGREPSVPGSPFDAPLATASVPLVPRQGGMVLDPAAGQGIFIQDLYCRPGRSCDLCVRPDRHLGHAPFGHLIKDCSMKRWDEQFRKYDSTATAKSTNNLCAPDTLAKCTAASNAPRTAGNASAQLPSTPIAQRLYPKVEKEV